MKESFCNEYISFETVSKEGVLDLIKELPRNKATVSNDITISLLKESLFLPIMKI